MRKRIFQLIVLQLLIIGCSAQRPVLYSNAQLNRVGKSAAEKDIDDCVNQAEKQAPSNGGSTNTLEKTGIDTATNATIGAAAGAAGGAVVGSAGTGAAVGAASVGAAGLARAIIDQMFFRKREPTPAYKNFVTRCLREKGYEPAGWQ